VNLAWLELLGYEREDVVGASITELMAPGEEAKFRERFPKFMRFGEVHDADFCLVAKDGTEVLVTVTGRVATDESGTFQRTHCILRDVTEQRRMQAALEESEERYRSIWDCAPMGMLMYRLERDGRLVFEDANPAAAEILGVDTDRFVGETIEEAFPALTDTDIPDAYRRVADGGDPWLAEEVAYDEQGISGAFEVHAFRIGRRRMVAAFLDVTQRTRDREELKQYRDELVSQVERRTEELERARTMAEAVTQVVARAVGFRDPYTASHQMRVAALVVELARELEMDDAVIDEMRMAAEVHDIGKLAVPAEILTRPSVLSTHEFALIKTHPETAQEILRGVGLEDPIVDMVVQHHERLDGSGYPSGLQDDEIAIGAKVLAVADVVEAMSSHRPYRPALGADAALEEIRDGSGSLYAPRSLTPACSCSSRDSSSSRPLLAMTPRAASADRGRLGQTSSVA
jgi:PAS domain S-box-containing protein/putative nucleotidyltransferase with HDIG domain